MNTDAIDRAFIEMLSEKGIHHKLGIKATYLAMLRYKIKNGIGISTDTKISMLQKNGWRQDQKIFTRVDLVSAVKFALKQSDSVKGKGPEYIIEKYLTQKA